MFSDEYKKETYELWGSPSDEVCFARQRLEKLGVEPYEQVNKDLSGKDKEVYDRVKEYATKQNKKVAVYLKSGNIEGLFVVSPAEKRDFENLCKYKEILREDKLIVQQMALVGSRPGKLR